MGKRSDSYATYPGVWHMFGGHVEPDEEPADVLKREFTAELGINPTWFDFFKPIEHNARFGKALMYVYFIT